MFSITAEQLIGAVAILGVIIVIDYLYRKD